jgi:nucleoside-diphosphate-sugar epimerase
MVPFRGMSMRPKLKVVVTGGSGRVGAFVVKELLTRGHEVINVDRRYPKEPGGQFIYAQLAQREQVQPILEKADAVCHLGEIPSIQSGPSALDVWAENTRAGAVVLQTAADLNVKRVIYTSSCQAYGMWEMTSPAIPQRLPFDETHPLAPGNAYAMGKAALEGYARMLAERQGLSVAAFRLPWVMAEPYSESVVHHLRPKQTRTDGFATYVHATDVARAYTLAIEHPRPGFEAYHFSAIEVLSIYPIAPRLREHHPEFPPLPADWPEFKSPMLIGKARDHFGWEPTWNLLDFYRAQHGEPGAVSN